VLAVAAFGVALITVVSGRRSIGGAGAGRGGGGGGVLRPQGDAGTG
jgi:hypothetical protein